MRIPALIFVISALFVGAAFAAPTDPTIAAVDFSALAQPGPYKAGFTAFVVDDPSRPGDGSTFLARPIPVYVWYPVDPETVEGMTPDAVYPLDPLYMTSLLSTSSDWEAVGMDPAWQEPLPSANAPFPLVMISPGWGAPAWMHMSYGTRLASHGYVVAVLYHFGDQWWPWEPPFDHISMACWNRPRDVSFALTELLARNETPGDLLEGAVLPDKVAASGWSLGGYASMVLAAGDDNVCELFLDPMWVEMFGPPPPETCSATPADPRIKAIMPLDGSNQVLRFEELARVRVPAMGMGEEWTFLALDPGWGSWQARQHAAFSGRPSYRVDVFNTNHQSFSDMCPAVLVLGALGIFTPEDVQWWLDMICTGITPWEESNPLVTKYMVAFLKQQFGGDPSVRAMLTPGYALTSEPLIEFFVTEKRNPNNIYEEFPGWPEEFIYFPHQPGSEQARGEKDPTGLMIARLPGGGHVAQGAPAGPAVTRNAESPQIPAATYIGQNFPNPFNPSTKFEFGLDRPSRASLAVYDAAGRLVRVVADRSYPAGQHAEYWDGKDANGRAVASGVYFYRFDTGTFAQTKKMVLVR